MSRKRCGMKGRIRLCLRNGMIFCHRLKCKVPIVVDDNEGNYCVEPSCPCNPHLRPKEAAQ